VHAHSVELEPVRRECIVGQGCEALVRCAKDVDARIFAIVRALSWDQVVARRLERSSLDVRAARERLPDVVRDTCGIHAQLASGAELALSARVEGVTRDDVRDALRETRELVKAATLRTTLHLHTAADLPLWKSLPLIGTRWREARWLEWQGLTLGEAERLRERVLAVLDDGEPRTRAEIGDAVGGAAGAHLASDSWGHFLAPASDRLCHGPPRGRNVTFVRCDRWVAGWHELDARDAQREACRRYLSTYGPARRDELEHWLAWRLPDEVWDGLRLEEVDVDGQRSFVLPGDEFPERRPRGVRLLSHYDVYVVACHPRDRLIPEQRERIFFRGAGPQPSLLVDGNVAGVWTRNRRGKRVEILVEPFRRLTRAQRAEVTDEAARIGAMLGAEPRLEIA
jgi:Winged helix DNA-binding domain